jgi:hypothetical protein
MMFEHDGAVRWGPVIAGAYNGGPPTIADLDGDGAPDIGVAGPDYYRVFSGDGSVKWQAIGGDASGVTGSTAFDFDGDGRAELVYANETELRVFGGRSGAVIFQTPNQSATWIEYPVVADVDNDGRADIVVASATGVRVFRDENNSWVNTRRIWNQHSYHITNINDDGTVPRVEQNSWQVRNTYRLNTFPDRSATAVPDLTVSSLRVVDQGTGQGIGLSLRVGNAGAAPVSSAEVAFYDGDPTTGGRLLGMTTVTGIAAGGFKDIAFTTATLPTGANDIYAIVDSNNGIAECREDNNSTRTPARGNL